MWKDHLRATRAASASHRVVKADFPPLALKLPIIIQDLRRCGGGGPFVLVRDELGCCG